MNKSELVKRIVNTDFSEFSEEKLEDIYWLIKDTTEDNKPKCPKCQSTRLALFSSFNYKMCTKCGERIEWRLGENQKPLIQHQR